MTNPSVAAFALVLLLLPTTASAQGFNVDCGAIGSPPSAAYGAAAGQAGTWNEVTDVVDVMLANLDGSASSVRLQGLNLPTGGCDDPATSGDDGALLDDFVEAFFAGATFQVAGLVPGVYDVYAYGHSPCIAGYVGHVTGNANCWDAVQQPIVGTAWTGAFQVGVTHARLRFVAFDGSLSFSVYNGPHDGVSGFQIVPVASGYSTFCPNVNPAVAAATCPCGVGAPGNGCANSFQPAGASLACAGIASVATDTLALTVQGAAPSMLLYFQGTTPTSNPNGAVLGDGIRCAGGTVVRLAVRPVAAGAASYPDVGDAPISVRGLVPNAGGLRTYQVAYRDTGAFCTSSTFNYSNGVAVYWRP